MLSFLKPRPGNREHCWWPWQGYTQNQLLKQVTALLQVNKYMLQGESLGLEGNAAPDCWLGHQGKKLPTTTMAPKDGWISLLTSLPGHYHTPGAPGNTGPSTISIQEWARDRKNRCFPPLCQSGTSWATLNADHQPFRIITVWWWIAQWCHGVSGLRIQNSFNWLGY